MSYTKTNWKNTPSTQTPLSAENLNHIEQGIYDAHQGLNELHGLAYGPLVASTVADMMDEERVYVYTGSEAGYVSGNWYYFDGSAWTSGGVYNAVAVSTDKTLSITDKAADAKATGDAIGNLNNALDDVTEKGNLFHVNNYTEYGVTWLNGNDGTFILSGTQIGTYDLSVVTLPAGTYTAYWEYISGSITADSNVSLRVNNSRWVNNGNTNVTITLSEDTTVYFRINNNCELSNYKLKVLIQKGEGIDTNIIWGTSAVDKYLRSNAFKHSAKIAFIGDSLTQGLTGGSSGSYTFADKPYPTVFKEFIKNYDITVLNFGRRGLSAKSYWNEAIPENGNWHSTADGEPGDTIAFDSSIDAVIIMFGTNGNLNNNTIDADTAIATGQTYLDYADTQCGDYCKIIEYIMEHTNNHAQIILVAPIYSTEPQHENKLINTLPTIQALGERYQIPVINALYESGLGKFNTSVFYNTTDLIHLNQAGYSKFGSFMASKFMGLYSTFDMSELT